MNAVGKIGMFCLLLAAVVVSFLTGCAIARVPYDVTVKYAEVRGNMIKEEFHKQVPSEIKTFEDLTKLLDAYDKFKGVKQMSFEESVWTDEAREAIRGLEFNHNTSAVFLVEIVRREFDCEDFCKFAAEHRNATVELLDRLADHPRESVWLQVTKNSNVTTELLRKIYFNPKSNFYVRGYAAHNPKAPPEIVTAFLQEAMSNTDPRKRCWASGFPRASLSLGDYSKLSKDLDKRVRDALARNPSAPISMLESLSEDADPYVSRHARETIQKVKTNHFTKKAQDFVCSNKTVLNLIGSVPEFHQFDTSSSKEPCPDGGFAGHTYFRVETPSAHKGCLIKISWRSKDCEDDFQPLEIQANSKVIWKTQ